MLSKEIFGYISVAMAVIGYLPYICTVLQKRTKPHVFSWVIWGTVSAIIYCAQDSVNAGAGDWAMGFTALTCFFIAGLALFYGEKKITRSDWISFVGALTAIPVWYVTQNPLGAVIMATIIDTAAYYPTFRKSYFKPYEENLVVYCSTVVKFIFALLALDHYSLVTVLSPTFIIFVESAFIMMVLWRRCPQKIT